MVLEHIRSNPDALPGDAHLIQEGPIHHSPTAHPPVWDMMLEIGNAMVLLVVASGGKRELEVGSLVDRRGAIARLQVAGGVTTLSGVRTPLGVRRRKTLPRFGGGRTRTKERLG